MQNCTTINGIIDMRQRGISFDDCCSRYKVGCSTITLIMNRFKESGKDLDTLKQMSAEEAEHLFFPPENLRRKDDSVMPDYQAVYDRLAMPGSKANLFYLWLKYKRDCPSGYQYTQYCLYFKRFIEKHYGSETVSMVVERIPREKVYIDCVGDQLEILVDSSTGEIKKVHFSLPLLSGLANGACAVYVYNGVSYAVENFTYGNNNAVNTTREVNGQTVYTHWKNFRQQWMNIIPATDAACDENPYIQKNFKKERKSLMKKNIFTTFAAVALFALVALINPSLVQAAETTGVVAQAEDGNWYYFNNGTIDRTYTGVAPNEWGWWYIRDGALDWSYTGPACNEWGWWYINNGGLDWNYTGMTCNEAGWWYVRDGALDFNYTGMACNEYGWWYYTNGNIDWSYTGLACNEYGWWYYKNGNIAWDYTGIVPNEYGLWYVANGAIDWSFCGNVTQDGVNYRVTNGAAEPAPVATGDLPGENRNGRYPDIPESVLPSSEAVYCCFFDNPIQVTTWDDVTGTIYADYARTQVIKEATSDDIIYVIGVGDKDSTGTAVAIYNNQYVIINEALFKYLW